MRLTRVFEERRKAKRRKELMKTAKNVGITAAACTSIGALGGVLLAPKSGKETRTDIKNKAIETNKAVKTKTVEFKNNINSGLTEKRNEVLDAKSRIKAYLQEKKAAKKAATSEESVIDTEQPILEEVL